METDHDQPLVRTLFRPWTCSQTIADYREESLLLSLVLAAMDSSIVATALVTIGGYFDDFESLQWIVLAYLLTYLCTLQHRPSLLSSHDEQTSDQLRVSQAST